MKAGLVQMRVVDCKGVNLARAECLVRQAAQAGADLVVLPEMFNCPYDSALFSEFAETRGGKTHQCLSEMARQNNIYLVGGSIPEGAEERLYNTSFVFDRQGVEIHAHRKVHLFDVSIEGGQHFRESDTLSSGKGFNAFETEFGKIGLGICFDLRFPEEWALLQAKGAVACVVPGAFNMSTGPAHWELLFRARALDNQFFMIGVSPAQDLDASYHAYGHSIAVNPWGSVLTQLGFEEAVQVVNLDLSLVESVRRQLPLQRG